MVSFGDTATISCPSRSNVCAAAMAWVICPRPSPCTVNIIFITIELERQLIPCWLCFEFRHQVQNAGIVESNRFNSEVVGQSFLPPRSRESYVRAGLN